MPESEPQAARDEIIAFMRSIETDIDHVNQVALLAAKLFDELTPLHGLGKTERLWLEAAARLHDIGWSVAGDGSKHHKHSARLIREHAWQHLRPHDIEIVAQIARYHRRSLPKIEHEEFAALSANDQKMVETLAALLRIADGLDRSHRQRVVDLRITILPELILVFVHATESIKPELLAAEKKSDLAWKVLNRPIRFEAV